MRNSLVWTGNDVMWQFLIDITQAFLKSPVHTNVFSFENASFFENHYFGNRFQTPPFSSFQCGRKAKTLRKRCVFFSENVGVGGALGKANRRKGILKVKRLTNHVATFGNTSSCCLDILRLVPTAHFRKRREWAVGTSRKVAASSGYSTNDLKISCWSCAWIKGDFLGAIHHLS